MLTIEKLKSDIRKFMKETQMPASRLGIEAAKCRHLIFQILNDERSPGLRIIDKIYATMKRLEGRPYKYRKEKK